jgi:hypothetical protein
MGFGIVGAGARAGVEIGMGTDFGVGTEIELAVGLRVYYFVDSVYSVWLACVYSWFVRFAEFAEFVAVWVSAVRMVEPGVWLVKAAEVVESE